MSLEFRARSASEYRQKFEEMRSRAESARNKGDERSRRSYEKLALGWAELIRYAERRDGEPKPSNRAPISNSLDVSLIHALPVGQV